MKTKIIPYSKGLVKILAIFMPVALFALGLPSTSMSLGAEPENMPMPAPDTPVQDMREAERQFEKGAEPFSSGETQAGKNAQRTGQANWSDVQTRPDPTRPAANSRHEDPRASSLMGSPETGYAGTWTDPATGDIITSVIAPVPPQSQNNQNYPIIIEPQVSGSDWGTSSNSGWQNGWPQWPGYVGEPGYGSTPPPFSPGYIPGANNPNNPFRPAYPANGIGPNIPPMGMNPPYPPTNMAPNFPPPAHPGYRPLRPWPPSHGFRPPNAGMPPPHPGIKPPSQGFIPPNQGAHPPQAGIRPPNAGMFPPNQGNNPGIWRPGMTGPNGWQGGNPGPAVPPRPGNGFMPGNPPGWKPLPLRPGGIGMQGGPAPRPGGF